MASTHFVDFDLGTVIVAAWLNDVNDWTYHATNAQTGTTYSPVLTDANRRVTCNNGSAVTFTVLPNSNVAFPAGTVIQVTQLGVGQINFVVGSGVTIQNVNTQFKSKGQYANVYLQQQQTLDTWILYGDTAA